MTFVQVCGSMVVVRWVGCLSWFNKSMFELDVVAKWDGFNFNCQIVFNDYFIF